MSAVYQERFFDLRQSLSALPDLPARAAANELLPVLDEAQPSIRKRLLKIVTTRSQGIPAQYVNAWHWAGEWVKDNGVTLPPDTPELRALRNFFCFQVNMYKKGTLSLRSERLLAQYGIDLSQYRAPNTGRGQLLDDDAMITKLMLHREIAGSYDLCDASDAQLIEWQHRLLDCYRTRGESQRMRAIAAQLPDFEFGLWMAPGELPVGASERAWWAKAKEFGRVTQDCPAYRGVVDPQTPAYLRTWASTQTQAAQQKGALSARQRGALMSLGLLANADQERAYARELALANLRALKPELRKGATVERDLKTFLGVSLLARMMQRNAKPTEIYATLKINPAQLSKLEQSIARLRAPIAELTGLRTLSTLRKLYHRYPGEFDRANDLQTLDSYVFYGLGPKEHQRVTALAAVLLQLRSVVRKLHIVQPLAKPEVQAAH